MCSIDVNRMSHFFGLFIFIPLIGFTINFYVVTFNDTSKIDTKCTLTANTCIFSDARVTQSNPSFYPVSDNNSDVQKIQFRNSTLQILTEELCNAFPNLTEVRLTNLSLKHIEKSAFYQCKQLINLNIWMNNFSHMDQDIFSENHRLIELNLQNNGLEVVHGQMFDKMTQLTFLNLAENALRELPVHEFPVLENLTYLFLHSNNLTDLDERELKVKFPSLQYININNNLFPCDRLKTIIDSLKIRKIKLLSWYEQIYLNRDLDLSTVEDILCVTKKQESEEKETKMHPKMDIMVVNLLLACLFIFIILSLFGRKIYNKFLSIVEERREKSNMHVDYELFEPTTIPVSK